MLHILLFLTSYIGSFIAAFVRYPVYAFVAYQVVYFFHPTSRWWGVSLPQISYSFLAVVTMAAVLVINYKECSKNKVLKIPAMRWMYMLLAVFCFVSMNAVFPVAHEFAMSNFIKLIVTMTIAFKLCSNPKHLDIILTSYIASAAYISFYVFQTGRNLGGRVEGIGMVDSPDANGLAAGIAPTLVLALYYFWVKKEVKSKLLMIVLGAFLANAIVLIASRGAFLAVAVSVGYFMYHMYFSSFQRKNQKKMAVFLTVFGLAGAVSIMDNAFLERIYSLKNETEVSQDKESGATRMVFWQVAVDIANDYPLGRGYQTFNYYSDLYLPQDLHTGKERSRTVHSTWFEALTEVGYIGAGILIMMILSCFVMSNKVKTKLKQANAVDDYFKVLAIEGALLAYIVAMTFLNRMRAENLYWCILFIAVAYNVYYLRSRGETTNER